MNNFVNSTIIIIICKFSGNGARRKLKKKGERGTVRQHRDVDVNQSVNGQITTIARLQR